MPATVRIGYGVPQPDGSYLNADRLADALVTTSVVIAAEDRIIVAPDVDLSFSPTLKIETSGGLTLQAPRVVVEGELSLGEGNFVATSSTLDLHGALVFTDGDPSPGARISGTSTLVRVQNDEVLLEQAIAAAAAQGATVAVAPGHYHENVTVSKPVTLLGSPGDPLAAGATPGAPLLTGTIPGGSVLSIDGVSKVTVSGFRMDATTNLDAPSAIGVSATSANELDVTNNSFDGFTHAAVSVQSSSAASVSHNLIASPGLHGIVTSEVAAPNTHDNVNAASVFAIAATAGFFLAAALLIAGRRRVLDAMRSIKRLDWSQDSTRRAAWQKAAHQDSVPQRT